jgi:hypothetical protein
MIKKVFLILGLFIIISVIPIANAQFSIGEPAYQKLTELIIDESNNVQAKHVIASSENPVSLRLFEGVIIESITVTNEKGEEKEFAIGGYGDVTGLTIFSPNQELIIKYDLENVLTLSDNEFTLNTGYPKTFGIKFSEKIELIFLNNNLIVLGDKKGISVNNGGYVIVNYYYEIPKIIQEVNWEENEFNVEIITEAKIDRFNFEQTSKSISFEVNEKNKFVTITISEELLGGPYVILLDNEKIQYNKSEIDGYVTLGMKPESTGTITIIGTTVIPEFSMFIPLIMGFLIILTVPFMKKFNLH